jgi:ectoine hydroxylase-related dioxygenase (phytanoyl-CoA dioxygenase family)
MGPFVQLDSLAINAFPSVDADEAAGKVNAWHRDRYSTVPQTQDYLHPLGCKTIFYFQDLTEAFGPLRVVPGSHRRAIVPTVADRHLPREDELCLYPQAGDVVFTHCDILHSGTPNVSGQPRYFMSASYNRSFMKHRDPLDGPNTRALLEEAKRRNDRRLMRLLGCDDLLWDRTNAYWFIGSEEERWAAWAAEDRAFMLNGENSGPSELVLKAPTRRTLIA